MFDRNHFSSLAALVSLLTSVGYVSPVQADEVLFFDDFRDEVDSNPNPVWNWDVYPDVRKGMMVGEDDIYEVVEGERFLSHGRSLRMDFSGRNGHCNTCSGQYSEVTSVSGKMACASKDEEQTESYIYNLTNHFTTWRVLEAESNSSVICFDNSSPLSNAIYSKEAEINTGDSIYIPRVCGVNGTIGQNIDRRSDCNKAINYLEGISSSDLNYGETISRRFYLYIPKETKLPDVTLKLGYSYWQRNGNVDSSSLKISVQRGRSLELSMPNDDRHGTMDTFQVPLDEWVYFEELFTRETSSSANDARYTLYASSINSYDDKPIVSVSDFTLGEIKRMSIGGNWQHFKDVSSKQNRHGQLKVLLSHILS